MSDEKRVDKIGKYRIEGTLGKGAMGLVYRAVDTLLEREVALKVITGADISEEMLERFRIEARAAAKLDHPNIVVVYDLGEERGAPYIAMELLEGHDLRHRMRSDPPLTPREAADLLAQVCDGLAYAHARKIVHRDIKPANIHLCTDGRVKIVDFGVAKMESTALTKTGMVIGTPDYMSPEQIQGKGVDARSDIFSTGVVLYEILSGVKPFRAESITSVVYNIVFKRPASFTELSLQVPADLERIVARAMAKELTARYQDIAEMRDDLRDFLSGREASPAAQAVETEATRVLGESDLAGAAETPATAASGTLQVGESPDERRRAAGVAPALEPAPPPAAPEAPRRRGGLALVAVLAVAVLGTAGWYFLVGPGSSGGRGGPAVSTTVGVDVVVTPWARIERLERREGNAHRPLALSESVTPLRLSVPPGDYRMTLSNPHLQATETVEFTVTGAGRQAVRHVLAGFDPLAASAELLAGP